MTDIDLHPSEWSFAKRAGFRFIFCFFVLAMAPAPINSLPWMGWLGGSWNSAWKAPITWTGRHLLRLDHPVVYQRTGSGDTMHDYIFMLVVVLISLAAAGAWGWFDRKRRNYDWLAGWLRVYLRYALATTLLVYGIMKVFDQQFFPPHGLMLTETFGQATPQRLAWTFVGQSVPYTVFAGALECLGGSLLLFRRTATLGAMVSAIVMTNVVMMNFCYDIPVKLRSTLYLLMALVILAPALGRLTAVFVLHRPFEPEEIKPPTWPGWRKWGRIGLKVLFAGAVLVANVQWGWRSWKDRTPETGPLSGLYEIEVLIKNGRALPPAFTDGSRWRWMEMGKTYLRIATVDGRTTSWCSAAFDEKTCQLTVHPGRAPRDWEIPGVSGALSAAIPDPTHLHLRGVLDGETVEILARKAAPSEFTLISQKFHWITELPADH